MIFKIMTLVLLVCATAGYVTNVQAQEKTTMNSNMAQIKKLRQEMDTLHQQIVPLRSRMKALMAQVQELRQELQPLELKMSADVREFRTLIGQPASRSTATGSH